MAQLTMNTTTETKTKTTLSTPNYLLRIEGIAVLAAASVLYGHLSFGWGFFALMFLIPDLAMVGYVLNNRLGSMLYNIMHTYTFPVALLALSVVLALPLGQQLALIWLAHIGFDRVLGYGLKYADAFKHTHMSEI